MEIIILYCSIVHLKFYLSLKYTQFELTYFFLYEYIYFYIYVCIRKVSCMYLNSMKYVCILYVLKKCMFGVCIVYVFYLSM